MSEGDFGGAAVEYSSAIAVVSSAITQSTASETWVAGGNHRS